MLRAEALGDEDLDGMAQQLLTRVAEESFGLAVDQFDASLPIHDDDRVRCRFQQPAELLFCPLSLCDVPDGAGDQHAFLGLQGAQADLYRELASVLLQTVQLQTSSHVAHSWVGEITRTVGRVLPTEALGHQHLDRTAEQLLALVAEEFLLLVIRRPPTSTPFPYAALVRCRFQQPAELLFRPLSLRDVPDGAGDEDAFLGLQRAQADLHG